MICAHISSLKILQVQPDAKEGEKGSGPDYTPALLPCYIPLWTKAERSIQYNTYIFHYEIAISFPAFYFMHPELYASFYITPRGWWGWVVSHARQLLSLEVTHRTHQQLMWQDLNMIPIPPFPQQQGQALPWQPCKWCLSADP